LNPAEEATKAEAAATAAPQLASGGISHAWRALHHRNFRLYFGGQSISLIGTWMTRIATAWLVYRLTHSALLLGTVSFVGQIPTFLLAPFAGVWIDRLDRRKVLVWTQVLSMVQSLSLAALTLSGHITIPLLLVLSAMQGLINAFDMPGRQSFMVHMVDDKRDLGNAIAINSSMVNMARLIGPSLAGLLIAATSEGWCFLIDGISYLAVIASLLRMRLHAPVVKRIASSTLSELKAGWTYVSGFVPAPSCFSLPWLASWECPLSSSCRSLPPRCSMAARILSAFLWEQWASAHWPRRFLSPRARPFADWSASFLSPRSSSASASSGSASRTTSGFPCPWS
jgi:MFS family permease